MTSGPNVNFSRLSTLAVALGKPTGVPRDGVQTAPLNLRFFKIEFTKYRPIVQALLLNSLNPKFSTGNVKSCRLISHFSSPPGPLPGFAPDPYNVRSSR